jgi:hypothetical protein
MTDVVIYQIPGHPRSRSVCSAMLEGINNFGDRAILKSSLQYRRCEASVAVFYGLAGPLASALNDYPEAGKTAVYIDLGYWGRKEGGRFSGFHKVSVNGRHPTSYFRRRPHDHSRAVIFELEAQPWRHGSKIVVAGMGPKGARAEGFGPLEWERQVAKEIRQYSDRPIIYRPKPNWKDPSRIVGTSLGDARVPLEAALTDAHAIVSHHSNANVEALVMGVPSFTWAGVAEPLSHTDFALIERPRYPTDRREWLDAIAWTQFSVEEMREGVAWRHLKDEGLVP